LAMKVELVGEWHLERCIEPDEQTMTCLLLHRMILRHITL
jgi:hypothetical protein